MVDVAGVEPATGLLYPIPLRESLCRPCSFFPLSSAGLRGKGVMPVIHFAGTVSGIFQSKGRVAFG